MEHSIHFIETVVFTRRLQALGLEAGLRALQQLLSTNPAAGATEAGTGGLRKVRMPDPGRGKGKRSGARVHYLHLGAHAVIYFVFVYGKHEQAQLTGAQRRQLRTVADAIRAEWDGVPASTSSAGRNA